MTDEILLAVILVLPGFLSVYLIRKISVQDEKLQDQEFYFWSLFLSVIIFIIFSILIGIKSFEEVEKLIFDYQKVIFLYLIAIIVGSVFGFITKWRLHGDYEALYGQVWSIALKRLNEEEGKFITIFTTDNLEFSGKIRIYSTREDSPREILIEEPIQIIRNEKMEDIDEIEWGKEILFTEGDIRRIVFYESTKNSDNCKYIKNVSNPMTGNAKEHWDQQIGIIVLIFTTYTVTKDLIDEKTVPVIHILYNSNAMSAIFYAGILLLLVGVGLYFHINYLKRQGKIK